MSFIRHFEKAVNVCYIQFCFLVRQSPYEVFFFFYNKGMDLPQGANTFCLFETYMERRQNISEWFVSLEIDSFPEEEVLFSDIILKSH